MRIRNLVSFGVRWGSGKQGGIKGPYILGFGLGAVRKSLEPYMVGLLIVNTIGLKFPSEVLIGHGVFRMLSLRY